MSRQKAMGIVPTDDAIDLRTYAAGLSRRYELSKRVLLMQTPQFLYEAYNPQAIRQRGFYAYPPRGLQCIKQALAGRGLDIRIADLNFELLQAVIQDPDFRHDDWIALAERHIAALQPSIIGLSWLTVAADVSSDRYYVTWLLRRLRAEDKHLIILGGPIATDEYQYYLDNDLCHFVVTGEGENKTRLLFSYLYDDAPPPLPEMRGIFYRPAGEIRESAGAADVVKPDASILPTYPDIAVEKYCDVGSLNPFSRMAGTRFGTILLNRGCRANCKFCGVTVFMGKGVRQQEVSGITEEIRYLVEERGVRHFELLDDDFLGTPALRDGVVAFLEELAEQRIRHPITWSAGNGLIASSIDRGLLELIHRSGCIGFRIGVESGNREMLKRMRKPTSLPVLHRLAKDLEDYPEIFSCGNYILGLFGEETFAEMLDTLRLVLDLKLDWAAFSAFQFTSKERARQDGLHTTGKAANDFVPTKDSASRRLDVGPGIVTGPEVLGLDRGLVPSPEQIKHIWLTFNLVTNYFANRNLFPGGNPAKLVSWLRAVQVSYPDNAYMPLFTALALVVAGLPDQAAPYVERARALVAASDYWQDCFRRFELAAFLDDVPEDAAAVQDRLDRLNRKHCAFLA